MRERLGVQRSRMAVTIASSFPEGTRFTPPGGGMFFSVELPKTVSSMAFFDAALADGANWTIALSCRTKTGKFLPTEVALYLLDTGDEVYVVGLLRDRSEHRG